MEGDMFEYVKGAGLFGLLAYMIYSDRADRKENVVADIKRSDAAILMANTINRLVSMMNRKGSDGPGGKDEV